MAQPPTSLRDLAKQLLLVEATSGREDTPSYHETVRLCEKLRISLIGFAGAEGFVSLLRRALTLASHEIPAPHVFFVAADGKLEGLEAYAANGKGNGDAAAVAITGHLLGLLVTFIGEPLTLRLVRDAYPNITPSEPRARMVSG